MPSLCLQTGEAIGRVAASASDRRSNRSNSNSRGQPTQPQTLQGSRRIQISSETRRDGSRAAADEQVEIAISRAKLRRHPLPRNRSQQAVEQQRVRPRRVNSERRVASAAAVVAAG
mgnify:CR=1 FL=1